MQKLEKVIGITGFKGSGKSTVASMLSKATFIESHALADPIKEHLCKQFGWTTEFIEKHKEEKCPVWCITPRSAMRNYGRVFKYDMMLINPETGHHRTDYWCYHLHNRLYEHTNKIIVSDIRYDDEVDYFIENSEKFILIRVDRPGVSSDGHNSETGLKKHTHDILIRNDSDLEMLNHKVLKIPSMIC